MYFKLMYVSYNVKLSYSIKAIFTYCNFLICHKKPWIAYLL